MLWQFIGYSCRKPLFIRYDVLLQNSQGSAALMLIAPRTPIVPQNHSELSSPYSCFLLGICYNQWKPWCSRGRHSGIQRKQILLLTLPYFAFHTLDSTGAILSKDRQQYPKCWPLTVLLIPFLFLNNTGEHFAISEQITAKHTELCHYILPWIIWKLTCWASSLILGLGKEPPKKYS